MAYTLVELIHVNELINWIVCQPNVASWPGIGACSSAWS